MILLRRKNVRFGYSHCFIITLQYYDEYIYRQILFNDIVVSAKISKAGKELPGSSPGSRASAV